MTAIEIKKALKDGMIILLIGLALVLAMVASQKATYLAPALEIFLLLYASFTGWSMFERERQEGAMEYLLSLPASRSRLFLLKFAPRAAAVLLVLFIYRFIHDRFAGDFLLGFFEFVLFAVTIFLLSMAMSLSMKSFLGTFFLTLFACVGLYSLIKALDLSRHGTSISIQMALSLLAVPILFFFMFQRFDIKPIYHFNITFIPALIVLVLLIFGLNYVTTHVTWEHSYLTADGHALKQSSRRTVFLTRDNRRLVFAGWLDLLLEDQEEMYACFRSGGKERPGTLFRLDMHTGQTEAIFLAENGWWFHPAFNSGIKVGGWCYFLLTDRDHKNYRIVGLQGSQTRIIDVKADFGKEYIHLLQGAAERPLQFIVSTETRIFRIFENGQAEQLFIAKRMNVWQERLLVFSDDGEMTLYRLDMKPEVLFSKQGNIRKIRRRFYGDDVRMQPRVLVKIDNKTYIFDMETLALDLVELKSIPYDFVPTPEGMRIVTVDRSEISVFEWKEGFLKPEKTWYSDIDPDELRIIRVFSSGVVVYNKSESEIFLFEENERLK